MFNKQSNHGSKSKQVRHDKQGKDSAKHEERAIDRHDKCVI